MDYDFYAVIEDRHGHEIQRTPIEAHELLDCDLWADRYAEQIGVDIVGPGEPEVENTFRVVIQRDPGSAVVWGAKTYEFRVPE